MAHQTTRSGPNTGPVIYTPGDVCYCGLYPEHTHQDHAERGPFLDGTPVHADDITVNGLHPGRSRSRGFDAMFATLSEHFDQ